MNGPLRLTVVGTGYLGTTHATCMANLGFEVLGVDTDPRRVDRLNAGDLPIYEPGLEELLHSASTPGGWHLPRHIRASRRLAMCISSAPGLRRSLPVTRPIYRRSTSA